MKKLNYLIVLFAVLFTVGFSSCGEQEEVSPKDDDVTINNDLKELLYGNTYSGEVLLYDKTMDIKIEFVKSEYSTSDYNVYLYLNDEQYYHGQNWEFNENGDMVIYNVDGESYNNDDIIFEIVGKVTKEEFAFKWWKFNNGEEPVIMNKI